MTTQGRELAKAAPTDIALLEKLVLEGDLSMLTPQERLSYYRKVCDTLGLAPFSRPFAFIRLSGKLTMYATAGAAEQIRANNKVSVSVTSRGETIGGKVYMVVARATTPDGRSDESIGVVNIEGKSGDDLANAMMKCETKAKRRVSMSICSLGFFDPPEISGIGDARIVDVDPLTGAMPGEEHRIHKADPAPAPQQPAPAQEAPRESSANVACRTCGIRPMLKSRFGPKMYHYTGEVDAEGKKIVHEQPIGDQKPAAAPAKQPEAPARVVDSTARPVTDGEPQHIGAVYLWAWTEKHFARPQVNDILGINDPMDWAGTPAEAKAKIAAYKPTTAESPSAAEKEVFG